MPRILAVILVLLLGAAPVHGQARDSTLRPVPLPTLPAARTMVDSLQRAARDSAGRELASQVARWVLARHVRDAVNDTSLSGRRLLDETLAFATWADSVVHPSHERAFFVDWARTTRAVRAMRRGDSRRPDCAAARVAASDLAIVLEGPIRTTHWDRYLPPLVPVLLAQQDSVHAWLTAVSAGCRITVPMTREQRGREAAAAPEPAARR